MLWKMPKIRENGNDFQNDPKRRKLPVVNLHTAPAGQGNFTLDQLILVWTGLDALRKWYSHFSHKDHCRRMRQSQTTGRALFYDEFRRGLHSFGEVWRWLSVDLRVIWSWWFLVSSLLPFLSSRMTRTVSWVLRNALVVLLTELGS